MARKSQPITVRSWVPDGAGGYVPLESLPPDELAAFRHKNAVRMAEAFQRCVNERPELLDALPESGGAMV